jgi:hypothetical protein
MTIPEVKAVLLWSTAIHYSILVLWFGVFHFAHDWLFRLHQRWFKLSPEAFEALTYGGLAFYKILVFMFNLVPLVALQIVFR